MTKREVVCGIEIHQQLDTHKLFCDCSSELSETFTGELVRKLRPTQSELGEVDRAALLEAQKKLSFRYKVPPSTCLVEADEEPPHPVNPEALETVLLFSLMVHAKPVDEVHYMRKIVIDGSNTAGFQRTALIAQGGYLEIDGKEVGVQSICLEEDAARPIERKKKESVYNLDRLGIPLIEIATDPDIDSPEMARKVAEHIGMLLRATGKVKRGIGTIREDLNVSIPGGARIEAKGVQELRLISAYVEEEVARQKRLLVAKDELIKRNASVGKPIDVTDILEKTESKIIRKALSKKGIIKALKLNGFAGLLGPFHDGKKCLGTELAGYAKTVGVGGLFHTDELPAYGITAEEVDLIRKHLELKEQDAFILVAEQPKIVDLAMERIIERANLALQGVPEETRDPLQDGTTRYSRPLPGKARMYPETDVPPVTIDPEYLDYLSSHMPEMPWEKEERLISQYTISPEQSHQLVAEGVDTVFEGAMKEFPDMSVGNTASMVITYCDLPRSVLHSTFSKIASGEVAKEAGASILDHIRAHPQDDIHKAIDTLGLKTVDDSEVFDRIDAIVKDRLEFVKQKEMGAVGALMGTVMKEFRGKVDGKKLNRMVIDAVERYL